MYISFGKPILDFLIALIALIILSPILLFVFIGLVIVNKGKPFFFQDRPGKNAKVFKIIKFKTMTDKRDEFGNLLSDVKRLTPIGRFIRKTSLDEVPQLLNVIKGDMSLIGPRPLLTEYLKFYNEEQYCRHSVKPGITGWAQVNGRNAITWVSKFEYDLYYVKNISFILDLKILLLTIKKVFISEGINSSSNVTMEAFNGKN